MSYNFLTIVKGSGNPPEVCGFIDRVTSDNEEGVYQVDDDEAVKLSLKDIEAIGLLNADTLNILYGQGAKK